MKGEIPQRKEEIQRAMEKARRKVAASLSRLRLFDEGKEKIGKVDLRKLAREMKPQL